MKIAVLVGSLRKDSLSKKIATVLVARAPTALTCTFVEIGDLPLYNEDLEHDVPAPWARFRREIADADGVLFVTPEYNRSIPGGLKNAIDVGSRPAKKSVFDGRAAGVVSVTPSKLGAFGANHALRQTFVFLNMPAMQQPEAYISNAKDPVDVETAAFLEKFMTAFAKWAEKVRR